MWEYNLNFMELINSEEFTFRDELEGRKRVLEKSLHEFQFEDLKILLQCTSKKNDLADSIGFTRDYADNET